MHLPYEGIGLIYLITVGNRLAPHLYPVSWPLTLTTPPPNSHVTAEDTVTTSYLFLQGTFAPISYTIWTEMTVPAHDYYTLTTVLFAHFGVYGNRHETRIACLMRQSGRKGLGDLVRGQGSSSGLGLNEDQDAVRRR